MSFNSYTVTNIFKRLRKGFKDPCRMFINEAKVTKTLITWLVFLKLKMIKAALY